MAKLCRIAHQQIFASILPASGIATYSDLADRPSRGLLRQFPNHQLQGNNLNSAAFAKRDFAVQPRQAPGADQVDTNLAEQDQITSGSATIRESIGVRDLPTSVVITGCDSLPILQQALDASQLSADGFLPSRSSSVKNSKGCGGRPVRTLQDDSPV